MHLSTISHVVLATLVAITGLTAFTSSMPTSDGNTLARPIAAQPSTDHAAYPHAGATVALPTLEHNTTAGSLIRRQHYDGQPANLLFSGFSGSNCDGTQFVGSWVDYGSHITFQPSLNSMILSRDLGIAEVLDRWSGGGGDLCGGTLYYSAPDTVGPIYGGLCYAIATSSCIMLIHY